MNKKLAKILKNSTFEVMPGVYSYVRVKEIPKDIKKHFMLTIDYDEMTVITEKSNVGGLDLIEKNKENYSLIALNVAIPFYSPGFLAAVSGAVAKTGINILIVSTYSKDYVLVHSENLDKALGALHSLGMKGA